MDLTDDMRKQINMLYEKKFDADVFNFDMLKGPMVYQLLPYEVVEHIHQYVIDPENSGSTKNKIMYIDEILRPYGFRRFAGGTNRVVYGYLEDQTFCLKVAIDEVGLSNNIDEFNNQRLLKPFVNKIFSVSECSTVATCERVIPILSRQEFTLNAESIFDVIVNKFVGKYILEDIGTIWFKNWGVRRGFGPVLLDYPYLYEVDLNNLFCNSLDQYGFPCGGQIDYDDGFNILYCTKCGKRHKAKQIGNAVAEKAIVIKGGLSMDFRVRVKDADTGEVLIEKTGVDSYIDPKKVEQKSGVYTRTIKDDSWRDEDFICKIAINGIKYGKTKDGEYVALGKATLKAANMPTQSENPFKKFITNPKNNKPPKGLPKESEVPDWAKDDNTSEEPVETRVIKIDMKGLSPDVNPIRNDEPFTVKVINLNEEPKEDSIKEEPKVSESNTEDVDNEDTNMVEENVTTTEETTENVTEQETTNPEPASEEVSEESVEEEASIDEEVPDLEKIAKAADDYFNSLSPEEQEAKTRQMEEETRIMFEKREAKRIAERNRIAAAFSFNEEDFERSDDEDPDENSAGDFVDPEMSPDVSEY